MIYDHLVLFPVILPLLGAVVGLLLHNRLTAQRWVTMIAISASLAMTSWLAYEVLWRGEVFVLHMGGWDAPAGITLVADPLSALMALMSQIVLWGGIFYGMGCKDQCARYPTFFPLFLTLSTGLTGSMLTGDLFNLFVFVELLVISGAVLTALSDDKFGVEAAFKYFYISLFAAIFLLLASGSLYAAYGTLNMADLARQIAHNPHQPLLGLAVASLVAAFMIKSAVIPFHFWQPDFHTAAPTPVHAVLSSVVVKVGVYGFIRMTTLWLTADIVDGYYLDMIQWVLLVMGAIGVFFGGLGAVGTYDAKRMLAYSTLGQLGFVLVGIGWGTPLALAAALIYAFNHSLIKAAMLMLAGSVASRAPVKTANFDKITGLGKVTLPAGVLFLLGGMALAGLPPTNGFISKLFLFRSGLLAESYLSLAIIGVGSLITLVYVGRAFQLIWWEPLPEDVTPKPKGDRLLAPTILIMLCLVLGLWSYPLLHATDQVVLWLNLPANYIEAVLGSAALAAQ
jgi:multicomponent Na+:H+ antiporter subunit D